MKLKKRILFILINLILILTLFGCNSDRKAKQIIPQSREEKSPSQSDGKPTPEITKIISISKEPDEEAASINSEPIISIINPDGMTLETRFNPPEGYTRIPSKTDKLSFFLRNLPLKEDQSKVLLYNGEEKGTQQDHAAVFSLDVGSQDLQQCADSIIRIYAEFFWSVKEYDKIAFHLTNGFLMEYTKWRDGNRIVVDGNDVSWKKSKAYDDSYECFRKYLDTVYAYAGTLSLSEECEEIEIEDIQVGDIFIKGGSPGHCILVIDMAKNDSGEICFLLAQGYMPAQDFHVLKNPLHEDDPWYYAEELTYPLQTPEWTFQEGSLKRWYHFSE